MLNRSACLVMSTNILKALPGKLDIKRHSPSILSIYFVNRKEWVIIIIVSMMTVMLLNYFLAIQTMKIKR